MKSFFKSKDFLFLVLLGIFGILFVIWSFDGNIIPQNTTLYAMTYEYGFVSTTFGSRILRVESVPLFIMSIINYEYMEW